MINNHGVSKEVSTHAEDQPLYGRKLASGSVPLQQDFGIVGWI